MDHTKATALKSDLSEVGDDGQVVPLDRFFDGNDDDASIGCNLPAHPGIHAFRETLADLAGHAEVEAVYLQIAEADPGPDDWPFTDTVLVVGASSLDAVKGAVGVLRPDDVWPVDLPEVPERVAERHPGRPVTAIWWD